MSRQRTIRRFAAISLAISLSPAPSRSQAAAAQRIAQAPLPDRVAIDSGRAIMLTGMTRARTPGASVTVMSDGKVIWTGGSASPI